MGRLAGGGVDDVDEAAVAARLCIAGVRFFFGQTKPISNKVFGIILLAEVFWGIWGAGRPAVPNLQGGVGLAGIGWFEKTVLAADGRGWTQINGVNPFGETRGKRRSFHSMIIPSFRPV